MLLPLYPLKETGVLSFERPALADFRNSDFLDLRESLHSLSFIPLVYEFF